MPRNIKTLPKVIPRNESRRWRNTRGRTSTNKQPSQDTTYHIEETKNGMTEPISFITTTLSSVRISSEDNDSKGSGSPYGSRQATRAQKILASDETAEEPEDEYLEMESMSSALDDIVPPTYECPLLSPTHSASSLDSEEEYFVMTSSGQLISMEEHERLYRLEQDMSCMNLKEKMRRMPVDLIAVFYPRYQLPGRILDKFTLASRW
ncbi:hypothetical protein PIIN_08733 [Serendipita indica DSM 11827]|uniref:Uncharacterized protein n=1 Tax=Serendipita indica (strain DSM 11827) TaxID=1109443 RepID=G4TTY2_SERID|nr:hypothetical protein PIIN_08733 [Serendipita indica DSM 11827]